MEEVAVAREDAHPPAPIRCPVGQGAEHVIGLIARGHAEGQIEGGLKDLLQVGQIDEEVLRRLITVGLVGAVRLVAEGGLGRVEGDHHPLGGQALAVVEQGLEEAVGHRSGDSLLGAQTTLAPLGKGIEAAKGQAVAVH